MRRVSPLVVLGLALACVCPPAGVLAQAADQPAGGDQGRGQRRFQPPPRAQRPGEEPPKGTSAIRGFVVAADTGAPLRRAQVRAYSAENRDTRVTTTDDQGRFELKELLGGRYTVTASKGGFVTLQYGQRRPSEQGTPLDVAAGQALDKVAIALPRGSVIAGRIVDELGEPVAGAVVQAMRYGYMGGSRRLMNPGGGASGGNDRTDDQGSFRLFGLTPGEYVVSASLRGGPMAAIDRDDDSPSGYAPTYYPGTTSAADAQRITVGVGEEASGITFALTLTRLVRVSGRALTSQGAPAAGAMVIAMSTDARGAMSPGASRGGAISADGTFDIPGLAPGTYVVTVRERGPRGGGGEFGSATVTVGTADLSGVTVTMGPGATASGRVVTDTGTPPAFSPRDVRITAMPVNPDAMAMMNSGPSRTNDDYTFELRGLTDTRVLRVTTPAGWSLASIDLDGQDVTDAPLDFRDGGDLRNLRVVLTQSVTDLSGLVSDDRGQPLLDATVVVFPDDEARWSYQSRYVRTARPDQQGRYQVKGLPPYAGYLVAVVQGLEDGQAGDPQFLATLKPAARSVSLGPGETKSFDVRR